MYDRFKSRPIQIGLILATTLTLVACATQPIPTAYDPPGFFLGLLHGAIAPIAFIGSLFADIRMYAFPNNGSWYDFGFLLGIGIIWGSAAAT